MLGDAGWGSVLLRVADRDESIPPVWSDDAEISSGEKIFFSLRNVTSTCGLPSCSAASPM